jgi:hypothetical protein
LPHGHRCGSAGEPGATRALEVLLSADDYDAELGDAVCFDFHLLVIKQIRRFASAQPFIYNAF